MGNYAYKQTNGLWPDGGKNEERGRVCINQCKYTTQHGTRPMSRDCSIRFFVRNIGSSAVGKHRVNDCRLEIEIISINFALST